MMLHTDFTIMTMPSSNWLDDMIYAFHNPQKAMMIMLTIIVVVNSPKIIDPSF